MKALAKAITLAGRIEDPELRAEMLSVLSNAMRNAGPSKNSIRQMAWRERRNAGCNANEIPPEVPPRPLSSSPPHPPNNYPPLPLLTPLTDSCASPSQVRREREIEFEEIWKLFPRKVSKGHALKAYIAARKQTSFEIIRSGVERHRDKSAGLEPQFIPHPATWINGKRWLDDELIGDNVFSFSRGPCMSYEEALREEAEQR